MKTGRFVGAVALAAMLASAVAYGVDLSQEPASLTVARSDLTNQYAVISWTFPDGITRAVVHRSFGEDGPWTEVADVTDAATWTDGTAPVGVPCYYKVAFADEVDGERSVGSLSSATVSHRRCQLLERDWNDMTQVKDGVTVIWHAGSTVYNNGDGVTRPSAAESAADAFDNNLKTHPNIKAPSSGRHSIGVDLGSQYVIGFVRCYPRNATSGQYYTNFNGLTFYGSNATAWYAGTEPAVTEAVEHSGVKWHEVSSIDNAPYRYVYAYNPSKPSWSLTVCEIQFYGWPADVYDDYAIGATELTAVQDGETVMLAWKDNAYGTAFDIERRTDGGEWQTITNGLVATSYADTSVALTGTVYEYRIVTVNGEAASYSLPATCIPYEHSGEGTGLHAEYVFPFITTAVVDCATYFATNAVDIVAATLADERPIIDGVEGSHTNVLVTWTGKLVAPFSRSYRLTAVADGMVSVYVDGVSIIRYSSDGGLNELSSRPLLAGRKFVGLCAQVGSGIV